MDSLQAISPIDGRYRNVTQELAEYFSEEVFFKFRVMVEVEYFIALCEIPLPQLKGIKKKTFTTLRKISRPILKPATLNRLNCAKMINSPSLSTLLMLQFCALNQPKINSPLILRSQPLVFTKSCQ